MFEKMMTTNAQELIAQHLHKHTPSSGIALDATLGNGNDLLFLSTLPSIRTLYGFDIQQTAIETSQCKLQDVSKTVHLIHSSHIQLDQYITQPIAVAMFNLGYLPTGDKQIVTTASSSLVAIQKTIERLDLNGIMTILTYPGHSEGLVEHTAIEDFLLQYTKKEVEIFHLSRINTLKPCPHLFVLVRKV